ncbi:hypothetical protein B7453_00360 [Pseudomonas sp. IB20]|uniref:hypothetical protein n=1 Tax=Pseudomonas TaxID=286 RepID=UPI000BDBE468|nr:MULTISPECIES: hypothetical protein [unclassified Pseudomonas]MCV2225572.1 hypothetical protein [Pseudomonas sp. AU10]OZO06482.1 hypothetical protein B7453_00360 [Pseudomonas sp. IB20]
MEKSIISAVVAISLAAPYAFAEIPSQNEWCDKVEKLSLLSMEARQSGERIEKTTEAIDRLQGKESIYTVSLLHRMLVEAHQYPIESGEEMKYVTMYVFSKKQAKKCMAEKPLHKDPEMFCMVVEPYSQSIISRMNAGSGKQFLYAEMNKIQNYELRTYLNVTVTLASQFPRDAQPEMFAQWNAEKCLRELSSGGEFVREGKQ